MAQRVKDPDLYGNYFDLAVGNPPYIGEKIGAELWRSTRERYPYWNDFVAPHVDYFYAFLVVGISKLRSGGRFGFITTEYWLHASGARPLRSFIAERCQVTRIIVFRNLRLFPDAPGQHSMIVIGERLADESHLGEVEPLQPLVSIYDGPSVSVQERGPLIDGMKRGSRIPSLKLRSFRSGASPQGFGGDSWADVLLSDVELNKRRRLRSMAQVPLQVSKGVETTLNSLKQEHEPSLTGSQLTVINQRVGRGIQLLSQAEVEGLGPLTTEESGVIRKWINTKDVFPYACVVAPDASCAGVIYLSKPNNIDSALSNDQVIRGLPIPDLPHIRAHLDPFRSLLELRTSDRNERRPWWTLHRPRADIVGDASPAQSGWARYCLTSRWGNGGKLIVGLVPPATAPASGLHVLRVADDLYPPEYVCAVLNSTYFQGLAEQIPPGQLRSEELEKIAPPMLDSDKASEIGSICLEQASLVRDIVEIESHQFPKLCDELRADISLSDFVAEAWLPISTTGPRWGSFGSVGWVTVLGSLGSQTGVITAIETGDELFGTVVNVIHRDASRETSIRMSIGHHPSNDLVNALSSYIRGLAVQGVTLRQLTTVPLPTDPDHLVDEFRDSLTRLERRLDAYRQMRRNIDNLIEDGL